MAFALLRAALGVNFLGHGIFRLLSGTHAFALGTVEAMTKSPLPHAFVYAFACAIPVLETLLGIGLFLGLLTRITLVCGALFMMALTVGVTSNQQWEVAGQQLLYSLLFALLLFSLENNRYSLDALMRRRERLVSVQ